MAEFILTFGTEISLGGADLPWDPLERYQALMAVDALEEASGPHLCNAPGSPGAKTSMIFGSPTKVDTVALDERHPILAQQHVLHSFQERDQPHIVSCNAKGGLEQGEDASCPTELSYDPVVRYSIMARNFNEARGCVLVDMLYPQEQFFISPPHPDCWMHDWQGQIGRARGNSSHIESVLWISHAIERASQRRRAAVRPDATVPRHG